MKGAPMMDNSKKHGTNANYKNSGMKYADGSAVKPGAPGVLGKFLDPLGLRKKIGGFFGKNQGNPNAAPPVDPNAVPPTTPVDPNAVAPVAAPVAAPVDPNAAIDPNTPGAPMKASPAKDTKSWTAQEMKGTAWMGKDAHNKKHKRKEFDSNHKPIVKKK